MTSKRGKAQSLLFDFAFYELWRIIAKHIKVEVSVKQQVAPLAGLQPSNISIIN